jgi:hypothetical protein
MVRETESAFSFSGGFDYTMSADACYGPYRAPVDRVDWGWRDSADRGVMWPLILIALGVSVLL